MDLNGFNKLTFPNFYAMPPLGIPYKQAKRMEVQTTMEPARDSRYPAYAGVMEDAHFVTDYRPHCNYNLPPGTQFSTKQWMVHHADNIIQLARTRESEWTGASLPVADTVPPPAVLAYSSPFENELMNTHYKGGIGTERTGANAVPLFGTYVIPPTSQELRGNTKNISLTQHGSGGRNTRRGANAYIP
jgi:hypothetical protein